MGEILLRSVGVKKDFGGLRAIDDLNFEIRKGEIFSIIGPNGSGKTTMFNLITGFLPVTAGDIFFKEEKISGLKPFEISRKGIARTFQLTTLFGVNTVLQNLVIGQPCTREASLVSSMFGLPGVRKPGGEESLQAAFRRASHLLHGEQLR